MADIPLALAIAAGTLAAVNPCGFALLPVYLSTLVLGDDAGGSSRAGTVARAMGSTAAITLGFVGVFGVFGLALAPVAGAVQRHLPWFTVVLGGTLVVAGGWLLVGRNLPGLTALAGRGPRVTRSVLSMVAFGAAYALASLGCTIGPFLAVVVSSFRAGSTLDGVALFLAYAAGMGLAVGAAALLIALAGASLVRRVRGLTPLLSRAAGAVTAIAGGYVAYYGWYELRVLGGGDPADPVVEAAGHLQGWLAAGMDRIGAPALAAVLVGLLAVGGLVTLLRK